MKTKTLKSTWKLFLLTTIAATITTFINFNWWLAAIPIATLLLHFFVAFLFECPNLNSYDFLEERNRINGESLNSNFFENYIDHEPLGCPQCNSSRVAYDSELDSLECINCDYIEFQFSSNYENKKKQ